jgi:hypothetical protein
MDEAGVSAEDSKPRIGRRHLAVIDISLPADAFQLMRWRAVHVLTTSVGHGSSTLRCPGGLGR